MNAWYKTVCLFAYALTFFCAGLRPSPARAQTPTKTNAASAQHPNSRFQMLDGRIELHAPAKPLLLGNSNELPLEIKGTVMPELCSLRQREVIPGAASSPIQDSLQNAQVKHHADGSTYVEFVPLRPGRLEVTLTAIFRDGMDQETVQVDVTGSTPLKLQMGQYNQSSSPRMELDLSEERRAARFDIDAIYAGISPVSLNPRDVTFEVITPLGNPAIQFDPTTAMVNALRIGHALITAKYQGVELKLCVTVNENNQFGGHFTDCKELIEKGKELTAEQDAATILYMSNLPYKPTNDGRRGRFLADERVDIVTPNHALQIAQDSAINLTLHGQEPVRVECSNVRSNISCQPWTGTWPNNGLTLTRGSGGNATVHIFPQQLGDQEYTFSFLFADGGVALKKIHVPVEIGDAKPLSLGKRCTETATQEVMPLEMALPYQGRADWRGPKEITPIACFEGVRDAISIPAKLVHYELHSEGAGSPVELDTETGNITAKRMGQVLITQTFAGLTYATCVKVLAHDIPFAQDVSNCRKLRASYGAPLPPLNVPVKEIKVIKDGPPKEHTNNFPKAGVFGGMGLINLAPRTPPGQPALDPIKAATISPDGKDDFPANERLTLLTKGITAVLSAPTIIPLQLSGPAPLDVSITELVTRFIPDHGNEREENSVPGSMDPNTIWRAPDGSLSVRLKTREPGTAKFQVRVLFVDGGVATQTFQLEVRMPDSIVPPRRKP